MEIVLVVGAFFLVAVLASIALERRRLRDRQQALSFPEPPANAEPTQQVLCESCHRDIHWNYNYCPHCEYERIPF